MMKVNVINRSEKNTHETINILLTPFESIIVTLEKEDDDDDEEQGSINDSPDGSSDSEFSLGDEPLMEVHVSS